MDLSIESIQLPHKNQPHVLLFITCLIVAWCSIHGRMGFQVVADDDVHITACGSFAREVPRRNFRSATVVSGEKV